MFEGQRGLFESDQNIDPLWSAPAGHGVIAEIVNVTESDEVDPLQYPSLAWAREAFEHAVRENTQTARLKSVSETTRNDLVWAARVFAGYRSAAYTCARAGRRLHGVDGQSGQGGWINSLPELASALRLLGEHFIEPSTIAWWSPTQD